MGANRRYPDLSAQRAQEKALREARTSGPLHTLTDDQLRLHSTVLSIAPERPALWGLAWVRFGDVDVRCVVRLRRWTSAAVGVEIDVDGDVLRCWVWRGAVDRLGAREDAWR